MANPPDTRRVVGGICWAKATSVSNDSRRIYGVDTGKIWLCATVLEVLSVRAEGAQRSSTLVKATYTVGSVEKVKLLNIAQLKKENPEAAVVPPVIPPVENAPAQLQENVGQAGSSDTPPALQPTVAPVAAGTEGVQEQQSNASSARLPVFTAHDRQWFEGDTELPTNGPFTRRTWRLTCQYTGREFTPGCNQDNQDAKIIDYFMAVFPSKQLKLMVDETNVKLTTALRPHPRTTKGEVLK